MAVDRAREGFGDMLCSFNILQSSAALCVFVRGEKVCLQVPQIDIQCSFQDC